MRTSLFLLPAIALLACGYPAFTSSMRSNSYGPDVPSNLCFERPRSR